MLNKERAKEAIKDYIDNTINDVMLDYQTEYETKNGDVEPLLIYDYDVALEQLADIVTDMIEYQIVFCRG